MGLAWDFKWALCGKWILAEAVLESGNDDGDDRSDAVVYVAETGGIVPDQALIKSITSEFLRIMHDHTVAVIEVRVF